MNELISIKANPNNANPNIERVDDLSEAHIKRARIHFKNGYQLSVIYGAGTYGLEIAIFGPDNEYRPDLYGIDNHSDDVLGHLTPAEVYQYINKVADL